MASLNTDFLNNDLMESNSLHAFVQIQTAYNNLIPDYFTADIRTLNV